VAYLFIYLFIYLHHTVKSQLDMLDNKAMSKTLTAAQH